MPERFNWMSLREVLAYESEMDRLGVSKVARSPRGFLTAYKQGHTAAATKRMVVPDHPNQTWGQRRDQFVARHLAQYEKHPTYRRWLALVAWAYRP
jgi:hypothetical protein